MLNPRGCDVDRPHSLSGSDVGNPRVANASLLVGSTWNPQGGSTPACFSVPRQANVFFFFVFFCVIANILYNYYFLSLEL